MMEGSAPPQQAIQKDDAAKQAAQTEKQSNKVDYDVVYRDVKQRVHSSVIENFNTSGVTSVDPEAMKKFLLEEISNDKYGVPRGDREPLAQEMYNDILGYGPIQELVDSDDYSEIMVNGPNQIYVEHKGKLKLTDIKFRDEEHLMNTIDRIVSAVGRHIDEASPMVDARLPDGSRVNVIIPPLSLVGAVLTIRKFGKKPITAKQLVEWGSLSPKMLNFLEACVKGKLNIIVSGGTGSGKTTLLNVLSSYIPSDERIVTIEDSAEVQLHQDHVVTLESRPANIEGKGAITIRDLVVNALRMRPDRIIVGEVRSKETLDMLQAMNTGHDGSLSTGHANSPHDIISRIETMVLQGQDFPLNAIRQQIASGIDIIVQLGRLRDKSRRVLEISEVDGFMDGEIVLHTLYRFEETAVLDSGRIQGFLKKEGTLCHTDKLMAAGLSV